MERLPPTADDPGLIFVDKKENDGPAPISDPPEPAEPTLVKVVRRADRIKPAPISPPAPSAPRVNANAVRPPSHYLANPDDYEWKQFVGVDGVIGRGDGWGPI